MLHGNRKRKPTQMNSPRSIASAPCLSRRTLLGSLSAIGIGSLSFQRALVAQVEEKLVFDEKLIANAEWIAGLELTDEERAIVASGMERALRNAENLRATVVDFDTAPALVFRPDFYYDRAHLAEAKPVSRAGSAVAEVRCGWLAEPQPVVPSESELPFASIATQASLLAARKLSSRELTQVYLRRIEKHAPSLNCIVTLLEEHALEQADASDRRRAQARDGAGFNVLEGIPWVAKDLIAVPPWKTTWGAEPFKDQVRTSVATVAEKLVDAGAVLLAKVTLGALAMGDQWFGGMTKNPWNLSQGSSGSSAGSAAAVAAGLATFALGSETLGSIVSPTRRCRTSGLRPTFGRVSRAGCMPLAWSMDKIGPIARYAEDLAYVFANLVGSDGRDPTLVNRGFQWPRKHPVNSLRIGLTTDPLNAVEQQVLEYFKSSGAEIVEIDLKTEIPISAMNFVLSTEAATVFDGTFRQDRGANYGQWTSTFLRSQFTPAIQYLQANRLRSPLIVELEQKLSKVDVLLGGDDLLLTNLTGHPSVVVACGSDPANSTPMPGVAKLTAAAYREDLLLHVAKEIQAVLPPQPMQPALS